MVVIVLGAPAGTPAVVQASAFAASGSTRGTPVFATPNAAGLHEAMSGAALTTPSRASTARAHHTGASQARRGSHSKQPSQDDQDSVDLPIFDQSGRSGNTGSLNEIFAAVADQDDIGGEGSPLNTVAGSSKVRKQWSFTMIVCKVCRSCWCL